MKLLKLVLPLLAIATIFSCSPKKPFNVNNPETICQNEEMLTRVIIYDVFTPPVASRIYGYTSLAAYEAMRFKNPKYLSLVSQLKGFGKMPVPEKGKTYNYNLAASKALFTVARHVVFSVDTLGKYETSLYAKFKDNLDDEAYNRSIALGEQIGNVIIKRANFDNYPQTRGKPRYLGHNGHAEWRPTPPDYLDGVEYCWGTMEPYAIESSQQFPLPHPPLYSEDKNSVYYKQAMEVYQVNKHMTPEQKTIAQFWDDNPFVVQHDGHIMYANKKITPGGHWMGITAIACRQAHADEVKTAQAYALTAIALFDSFICSWEAKYQYSFIRPVTVINETIDPGWLPMLQTPPFPEYPAGHACISAASATMLTKLFGEVPFNDTTEVKYIGLKRKFESFQKAASETADSRFYGGIHFRNSEQMGSRQGREVGNFILSKLRLTQ
jgi:hypothetical protein